MTSIAPVMRLRETVDHFLSQFRGQRILLYPNPGNAGDCLILTGTVAALDRAGVQYSVIPRQADVTGATVLVGGGGNLVPLYRDISDALERFLPRAARIVILPHTIRGHSRLLRRFNERVVVLCREAESLKYVRRINPHVESALGHDMAFHIDAEHLLARTDLTVRAMPIIEASLATAGLSLDSMRAMPRVRFMRTDIESTGTCSAGHMDLSATLGGVSCVASAEITTFTLLKIVSTARHIETDRLHVAIAAALCDVPCDLHDNSYGKNGAVFAASLSSFANVRLVESSRPANAWDRLTPDERKLSLRRDLRPKRIVKRIGFWARRLEGMVSNSMSSRH